MLKSVSSITNAIGALNYVGTWNASTNTPTIVSSVGIKGDYYVVSVSGATSINGVSNWGVGDLITYNGSTWQRVEGGADLNGVNLTVSNTTTLSGLTASTALALDASKNVVSVTNTGTGNNVLATSPTLTTPVLGAASATSLTVAAGNLLVGDTSLAIAGTRFSVIGTTGAGAGVMSTYNGGSSTKTWQYGPDGNGNFIVFTSAGVGVFLTHGGTTWTPNISDERLKNKIGNIDNALDAVSKLNPLKYYFQSEEQTGVPRYGFFAQNVGDAIPDAKVVSPVQNEEFGDVYTYNAEIINVYLVKAIQEQQALINSLTARVSALEQI